MATREELVAAVVDRYGCCDREEKTRILDEFVAVTGFHRKHAMRLLRGGGDIRPQPRPRRRIYDAVVRDALVEAMERHGYLEFERHRHQGSNSSCGAGCVVGA